MIRSLICTLLLIVLCQHSYAQSPRLTKAAQPVQANLDSYFKAHCVSLPQGVRVCKGLSDPGDAFVLERDGTRIGTWPGIAQLGETSDFEVLQGDLDNDGHRELIVANLESTSVGMAVNVWTIYIFRADLKSFETPLSFSVEEYGAFGTFVTKGKRVEILATRWLWTNDPARRRGHGLYLVGQWWRYLQGELVPSTSRTMLARRYLESFAKERDQTISSPTKPFKWFTDPRAETFRVDPLLAHNKKSAIEGVITNISSRIKDERITLTIEFRPDEGVPVSFGYPQRDSDEMNGLTDIGDVRTNRLFPLRYVPTSPDQSLVGRRATVITYGDEKRRILWLGPKN